MNAMNTHLVQQKLAALKENLNKPFQKLILPTQEGCYFIALKDILFCKAEGNYTSFHLENQEQIVVSKTLKIYAQILEDFHFFRVSRSHLININHVKKYNRSKTPSITMKDGAIITLSLNRRDAFMKMIYQLNA